MRFVSKRFALYLLCAAAAVLSAACGSSGTKNTTPLVNESADSGSTVKIDATLPDPDTEVTPVSLSEGEQEVLGLVEVDIHKITDENYVETVMKINTGSDEFFGSLYQLEGVYVRKNNTPYVARIIILNGEKVFCGIPLKYMEKNITEGAWIRVTGVIQAGEVNGKEASFLEVVAAESMSETGQRELEWSGSIQEK